MSMVSSAVAIGGSIWGADKAAGGQEDAANTYGQWGQKGLDFLQNAYNTQQENEKPWQEAGRGALSQMQDMTKNPVSFSQQDFMNNQDPAYQWDMDQGMKALQASAAARGGLMSGGTLKDITKYSQGMASNEYQNAYSRFMNNQNTTFNRLGTIAGYGQNANAASNAAAQNFGNSSAGVSTDIGGAIAGTQIARGNIWGNAISGIGSQLGKGLSMNGLVGQGGGQGGGMAMGGGGAAGYNPAMAYGGEYGGAMAGAGEATGGAAGMGSLAELAFV